ncbi:hypothetical protein ACFLQ7_04190, partial [Actinomycetota bacterium]
KDFAESMRDEQDGSVHRLPLSCHVEDEVCLFRGEGGGDLVEHQESWIESEGPCEIDEAKGCEGYVAGEEYNAIRKGLVFVPADRQEALLPQRSVRENLALPLYNRIGR